MTNENIERKVKDSYLSISQAEKVHDVDDMDAESTIKEMNDLKVRKAYRRGARNTLLGIAALATILTGVYFKAINPVQNERNRIKLCHTIDSTNLEISKDWKMYTDIYNQLSPVYNKIEDKDYKNDAEAFILSYKFAASPQIKLRFRGLVNKLIYGNSFFHQYDKSKCTPPYEPLQKDENEKIRALLNKEKFSYDKFVKNGIIEEDMLIELLVHADTNMRSFNSGGKYPIKGYEHFKNNVTFVEAKNDN